MNFNILRGKIAEKRLSQKSLALKIGMSQQSLSRKMLGKREFSIGEAEKICEVLQIPNEERADIFLR